MTDVEWVLWSVRRPVNTEILYRWRIPARMICGMMLRPEWSAKLQCCGMGYGPREWWPRYSSWNGWERSVPEGMEWRLAAPGEDEKTIFWGGLDLLPCPHTGYPPNVGCSGAPWFTDRLYLEAWMVRSYGWTDAARMAEAWNRRAPISTIP